MFGKVEVFGEVPLARFGHTITQGKQSTVKRDQFFDILTVVFVQFQNQRLSCLEELLVTLESTSLQVTHMPST